ncbi:MAG TPA: FeoA family protein [Magnetospirillaceae bacterium]|nr:FeoA family protein [Magnetospirillaceae bacterium]
MGEQLKDLPPGSLGEVLGYSSSERTYRDRLLAMGLTKGTRFTVLRVAPLGDPVEIEVRGFQLTLRKGEADVLSIRRVEE